MNKLMDKMIKNFIKNKSYGYEEINLAHNLNRKVLGCGPKTFLKIINNQKTNLKPYYKYRRYYLKKKFLEKSHKKNEKKNLLK